MKRSPFLFIFLISTAVSLAQNRVIKNYYDNEKLQIKESYKVLDHDTSVLDGMYKTYYQNGKIKTIGFYTKGQATDYWEYFYQNGNVKMEGIINNFFNQGHWIFYFENGNKSMEGNMDKGKKNGFWRFYNDEGKLRSEGMIKEGKNDGEWKYYYDEGIVKAVGDYQNGVGKYTEFYPDGTKKMEGKIKFGKSDSTWTYYHPNGVLKAKGTETNGLKEGKWIFYFENRNAASEGQYKKGETTGEWKYYSEDGTLNSKGNEKNGKKDGEWTMYTTSGKIKGKGNFENGTGDYIEYHDNGKVKLKGSFLRGKYDGKWEYYYEDEQKEGECLYNNGEGWYTGYFSDGNKKMEGLLKDGNKSGIWKIFKQDGNLAGYYKTYFEDNQDLKEKTVSSEEPKEKSGSKVKPLKKKAKFYFPQIYLYRPNPLFFKTFIFSVDPFQLLLNSLPVFLEYYVQEKWGLELSFAYNRNPLAAQFNSIANNQLYQLGQTYSVRYKKYFANDDFIGRPYIGGEYRHKDIDHSFNTLDLSETKVITAFEHSHEAILIVGDRFMKNYDKKGITLDLYLGIGIGYKSISTNYIAQPEYDATFGNILKNNIYPPFRFGLSIGYAF